MTLETTAIASTVSSAGAALRAYETATPHAASVDPWPVVFLHAGVCDSRMWTGEMKALSTERRTASFDRRGFGETRAAHEPYSNVDDTIAVMDALGIGRAVLVGCSNGGRVALDTYFAHRDRVAGLVLICAAVGGAPWTPTDDPKQAELERQYEEVETRGDRDVAARFAARYWLDGPLAPEGRVEGPVRELFLDMMRKSLVDSEAERGVVTETAYGLLGTIDVPTLVVRGPLDEPYITALMEDVATRIPHARSLEIPGTAHLPSLERPDVFVPALRELLASTR